MKKLLSIILAAAMALTLLAGCSSDPGGASQAPSNPPADNSQPAENPPEAAGSIKLAALSSGYITNYPDMWKEVCEAFTAETGVEVELTLEKNLEEVIGPSMQGGDYPDVILCATGRGPGLTEQFIKDRLITDISDVLDMTIPRRERHRLQQGHAHHAGHQRYRSLRRR